MPSKACVVKSSSVSPLRLFVLEMQSYRDLMPSGHQRSRVRVGLLQRTQATAISAFGPSDACDDAALLSGMASHRQIRGAMAILTRPGCPAGATVRRTQRGRAASLRGPPPRRWAGRTIADG